MPRYVTANDIRAMLTSRIETTRDGRPRADAYPLLTQKNLAEQLEVSQGFISQFLSGQRPHPSAVMLDKLGFDPTPFYRKKAAGP